MLVGLLLVAVAYCEFMTVVSIDGIGIEEGYLGDALGDASEFLVEMKLKPAIGNTYASIELSPWTEKGYRVESVTKSMEWLDKSYVVSDRWPYSAEIAVTYNGMANKYGTIKVNDVLEFDANNGAVIASVIHVASESGNEKFFDMRVSITTLNLYDGLNCDGSDYDNITLDTPAALLLLNDGGQYIGCFDSGDGECWSTTITMTRARRIGTKYLPDNAFMDDYVGTAYKNDVFLYTQYARDTRADTSSFFPVINGVADVLVSIKSIVNTRPEIPVTNNIALRIYEDFSTSELVAPSLLYTRPIDGDFFSQKPENDIRVVSHISIATRERLANNRDHAAIKIAVTDVNYPPNTYSVSLPVSSIARYDGKGDENVATLGIYEVRYTVIPIEAVYAIVDAHGKLTLTRKECAASIYGAHNNVTIPPTHMFSSSMQFSNTRGIGDSGSGSVQLPFYGFLVIAGGLVLIIVIAVIIALCCCLEKRSNHAVSIDEVLHDDTAQKAMQDADNL